MRGKVARSKLEEAKAWTIIRSELEVQMRGKVVRSGVEDAKAQTIMRGMERAMFFKEDTTFNDIRDKSLQQWLDEMEQHLKKLREKK